MGRAVYRLASHEIRQELDAILDRPRRTTKRQQQAISSAIQDLNFPRTLWPREYASAGTRSDAVLFEKVERAIMTGRITREECKSLIERIFDRNHGSIFDPMFDELERSLRSV